MADNEVGRLSIGVDIDDAAALAKLRALAAAGEQTARHLDRQDAELNVDTSRASRELSAFFRNTERRLDAFKRKEGQLEIEARLSFHKDDLNNIRRQIKQLEADHRDLAKQGDAISKQDQKRLDSLDEQLKAWEKIKRAEHTDDEGKPKGMFDTLPESLPPLSKAYRINSKAARVGFTWQEDEEVEQQVEAEWLEWLDASASGDQDAQKHELGDLLFSIAELGRRKGIKANEALDYANRRFLKRFARMEELAREQNLDFAALTIDEKDELWNTAKAEEEAAKA